jgi:hypothetical protein
MYTPNDVKTEIDLTLWGFAISALQCRTTSERSIVICFLSVHCKKIPTAVSMDLCRQKQKQNLSITYPTIVFRVVGSLNLAFSMSSNYTVVMEV